MPLSPAEPMDETSPTGVRSPVMTVGDDSTHEMALQASTSSIPLDSQAEVSVLDHEAFAARYMPEHNQIPQEDIQVFHWELKNYRRLDKRMMSPSFECGGHKWNILLFPMGNSNGQANEMVSVYLNYGETKGQPEGWHCCAQFCLAISSKSDPTHHVHSHANHRFTSTEQDWGFTRFTDLRKLLQGNDTRGPLVENDEVTVTAYVRVLKDETGVLWHNFQDYDSKKETGHVGLKNQGATCYMNSLLQSLFFTNAYRRAVYQIPTEEDNLESFSLALQRVFYLLQSSDQPVSTSELTRSFGWKGIDSFLQHDVQEFNRVLQDKLESKMKGTSVDGEIKRLFSGKYKSYIKCINVDYESARSELFYDIQLNVKGMKNVEEAFKDYIAEETLEGENRYQAEGLGLQDAKKGVIFESFPPVLHLQLKRFEYDMMRDINVKINDRYEFPLSIDLQNYLDESADRTENWNYKLHGVLVHSGDVHGGHYFVFIKPEKDGKWYKIDDDRVTPCLDREVLEDNFGGEFMPTHNGQLVQQNPKASKAAAAKRINNAYMLVYIRESMADEILAPISETDTPSHLRERLEREQQEVLAKKKEKEEQHLYLTTKIITDDSFRKHSGFDLATFEDRNVPVSADILTRRVLKNELFDDFKAKLCEELKIDPDATRFWILVNRQNKTVRPDAAIPVGDPEMTMDVVREKMGSRTGDLKLYVEVVAPEEQAKLAAAPEGEPPIMIFIKHFDVSAQTLTGVGHFYVHKSQRVGDLCTQIYERTSIPSGTPLKIYEEIKPGMIEIVKQKSTFFQSEIQDGDILCFQVEPSEAEQLEMEKLHQFVNPVDFYDFFQNRVQVVFKPRFEQNGEVFELMLSKKMLYDQIAQNVGAHLKYPSTKIRFTTSHGQNNGPKNVVKRAQNHSLAEMIQPTYATNPSNLLYYELLDVSLAELETKKNVKVTWMGMNNKDEGSHNFLLPKTTNVAELIENLNKNVKFHVNGTRRIRVFEVSNHGRAQRIFSPGDAIKDFDDRYELYAEEVSKDETEEHDKLVSVFHYSKDPARTFGVPFKFTLKRGEAFVDTKKRLQARIAMGDKEFSKVTFLMFTPGHYKSPLQIEDEDVISDHKWQQDDAIGMDHIDRTSKSRMERAVYIN